MLGSYISDKTMAQSDMDGNFLTGLYQRRSVSFENHMDSDWYEVKTHYARNSVRRMSAGLIEQETNAVRF